MLSEFSQQEVSAALDEVVESVLRRGEVLSPPVDAFELARRLGLVVAADDRQRGRARRVRLAAHGRSAGCEAILLRSDPRQERRQWAVAHELGEQFAHQVFAQLGLDPRETRPNLRESMANQLAGRLLLPGGWYLPTARECDWDLPALKRTFATASHELIARRMLEFETPVVMTVVDQRQITWRRANQPFSTVILHPEERVCLDQVHTTGMYCERSGELRVRGWPIHEPDWRREILRAEIGML